jgi:hypothetical protein
MRFFQLFMEPVEGAENFLLGGVGGAAFGYDF